MRELWLSRLRLERLKGPASAPGRVYFQALLSWHRRYGAQAFWLWVSRLHLGTPWTVGDGGRAA